MKYTTKYGKDFDLKVWTDRFFQDEAEYVTTFMGSDLFQSLVHTEDGSELPETITDDFMFKLVKKRCHTALQLPVSDRLALFISMISANPGMAVMYCTAYAVEFEYREVKFKDLLVVDPALYSKPDMRWLSFFFCSDVTDPTNSLDLKTNGLPGQWHLENMWRDQKIGDANMLDYVEVVNPTNKEECNV